MSLTVQMDVWAARLTASLWAALQWLLVIACLSRAPLTIDSQLQELNMSIDSIINDFLDFKERHFDS